MQAGRLGPVHLSCLGEISAGFGAHPLYTPVKKYNSICVGSFGGAGQPFVKCGVIQRLFLQRSGTESPSWQFCRQIREFPALWKVSGQKTALLQCCGPERRFWWPSGPGARPAKMQTEWSSGVRLGVRPPLSCEADPETRVLLGARCYPEHSVSLCSLPSQACPRAPTRLTAEGGVQALQAGAPGRSPRREPTVAPVPLEGTSCMGCRVRQRLMDPLLETEVEQTYILEAVK